MGWPKPATKELPCTTSAVAGSAATSEVIATISVRTTLFMTPPLANRIVNRHEFRTVREGGFHLHFQDHFGDTFHDLLPSENFATLGHKLRDGFAIACSFEDEIGDEGYALGIVELDSSRPSAARNERGDRDHQLVPLPWQKIHVLLLSDRVIKPTTSWVAQTTRIG